MGAEWFASDDVSKRPKNLGHYMGYRITQAYYQRATNTRQATEEQLNIGKADAFLTLSGYGEQFSGDAR